MIVYGLNSINIFLILIAIAETRKEVLLINQLSGLFKLNKGLALALAFSFLSLAAIPPLAGFFAKLQVINSLFNLGYYWLPLLIIITSVISTANYLQIIKISHLDLPLYPQPIKVSKTLANVISILTGFITLFILKPCTFLTLTTHLLIF